MPPQTLTRPILVLRAALVLVLLASFVFYIVQSIHWPLMVDSPIMHYVNFLMEHGMKPYGEITDMNMPGSYLTDAFEMHVFGGGDLALRIYEFFLMGVLTAAMIVIARPYDWLAGLFAGGYFTLLHASEGPKLAVEREEVLTALFFVGLALLFTAVRRQRPLLTLLFGFCVGLPITIKPTVGLLPLSLLLLLAVTLHRRRTPLLPYLAWSVLGIALALSTSLVFLLHYGALGSFFYILHNTLPSYVAMKHPGFGLMLRGIVPINLLLLVPLAAYAYLRNTRLEGGWNWERWALALGAVMGLVSYFAQRKGFLHHRYMFLCFLLLILGLELTTALRRPGVVRLVGAVGLLIPMLLIWPRYLRILHQVPDNSIYTLQLERDIAHLGGDQLQHQIFCVDLVYGCLNTLYHLGLVENTGYTGDLLLFTPDDSPAVRYYRSHLLELQAKDPANVMVVSNEWLERPNTFDRLDTWPQFQHLLAQNYTQVLEREFPLEGRRTPPGPGDNGPPVYRIYVRNGTPLLAVARDRLATP